MLSPRWYKVIRDLWANKTRTLLVVMAIAVGVFAFGSVFTADIILLSEMDTQYREIRASSITMYLSSFNENLLRWMERQPEITSAQGRTTLARSSFWHLSKRFQDQFLQIFVTFFGFFYNLFCRNWAFCPYIIVGYYGD